MKTKALRIISVLILIFCAVAFCSCDEAQSAEEKIAAKNTKEIVGVWIVESVKNEGELEELADFTARATTHTFFVEGKEVQFLSNGTFTSSIYNLKYEMVDNQFIYTYKEQSLAYDCEITGDTMTFSTPGVITVTLKKQ